MAEVLDIEGTYQCVCSYLTTNHTHFTFFADHFKCMDILFFHYFRTVRKSTKDSWNLPELVKSSQSTFNLYFKTQLNVVFSQNKIAISSDHVVRYNHYR